jgi:cytochrome P450
VATDTPGLAAIDLTDLDNFAAGFPHHLFEVHRREAPVWWHEPTVHTPDGEGFWSVATYAETTTVLHDPVTYSSARGGTREQGGTALKDLAIAGVAFNMMDDPRHARIRKLVASRFTARALGRLEAALRGRVRRILGELEDGSEVDFVDVATEVPLRTICLLLGVPEEDRHQLWDSVDSGSDIPTGDGTYEPVAERRPSKARMFEYAHELMAEKRRDPADDVLSIVIHGRLAGVEPGTMSDTEVYCFFRNLFGAGWETTRAAIAGGLLALMEHPRQLRRLRADPALMPTATEEILRWTTPSPSKRRTATRETVLAGNRIGPGDKVLVWEGSANRDDQTFAHAMEFDVGRSPNPHLSFGSGVHYCLGAQLARLESRVLYEELLATFPRIERTGAVEWTRGSRHTGLRHLRVRLDRRARPSDD